jgi:alternate signal-mediated exported protein
MNKLVKGSIAGAAGITLLLGGLGSFALWNDSTTVAAGAVNSGELQIVESSPRGSWTFEDGTAFGATSHIVPGDTVVYAETFTVKAKGDNLRASLTHDVKTPTSAIEGTLVTTTFAVAGVAPDPITPKVYTFNQGTYTVTVTITVEFPQSTEKQTGQNQTFTPGAVNVTLQQL